MIHLLNNPAVLKAQKERAEFEATLKRDPDDDTMYLCECHGDYVKYLGLIMNVKDAMEKARKPVINLSRNSKRKRRKRR